MDPSPSMDDDIDFEHALGQLMESLQQDTIEGLVNSCMEQAEQEAAAEPMSPNVSMNSHPPTADELEAIDYAAQVGCFLGESGHNTTMSDDPLAIMDYRPDADDAATPNNRFLIQ